MFKLIVSVAIFAVALGVPYKGVHPKLRHGRIVGGEETTIEKFPYQVSVRAYDEHFCGGTIIDEYTILTAAHCTDEFRPAKMSVMVGSTNVEEGGIVHQVADYYQHHLYNDVSYDYDISIIKLSTPITFTDKASPIALQEEGVEVEAGVVATISGWGDTIENDEGFTTILRKVDVDVISKQECKDAFNSGRITDRMLCARRPGKDSCQGDSGGPLVANNKLIGVVSWGIGCARPKYPGIYTKVSYLRKWIDQNK